MTEQRQRILQSSDYIQSQFPKNFNPEIALVTETQFDILDEFKIVGELDPRNIPPQLSSSENSKEKIKLLFAKIEKRDVLILKGRFHYYEGISMQDIGYVIYTLKFLGIKTIISLDEVGHLNPRFACGELTLVFDHINLMGNNPLIGKNDDKLGVRFPDMSNAYDRDLFDTVYGIFQDKKVKVNESVYMGVIGPEGETEAEARFYRDVGADVVGYSIIPENITAVHCGIKFIGVGLITRHLVADQMMEEDITEKQREKMRKENLRDCEGELNKVLKTIIKKI